MTLSVVGRYVSVSFLGATNVHGKRYAKTRFSTLVNFSIRREVLSLWFAFLSI